MKSNKGERERKKKGRKQNEEVWWGWGWFPLSAVKEKSIWVLKRSSSERLNGHGIKTNQWYNKNVL